jgi:phosphoadenosine phosphosulfate reductase
MTYVQQEESTVTVWTPALLKEMSDSLEGKSPETILRWGLENFAPDIALATGFGPEGVVLMHLVSRIAPETTIFYLDTGLLFKETYELRDRLQEHLKLRFTPVSGLSVEEQAEQYGPRLWSYEPNQCCYLRKVAPLRQFLSTQQAWITAIRRDQTRQRANAGLVEWDKANKLVKLNPLAHWTSQQVWAHIMAEKLPYNPLHDQGYPSIGCWPCTQAVAAGADPRSGRWNGFTKNECGIHLQSFPQE